MKGVLRFGPCLALGFFAAWSFAEDNPWRPAGQASRPAAMASQPAVALPTVAVPAATTSSAISLRAPVPLTEPAGPAPSHQPLEPVAFRPIGLQRPAPVIRAKPDDPPRPLPVGPVIRAEPTSRSDAGVPLQAAPAIRTDNDKVEEIPVGPKVLQSAPPPYSVLSDGLSGSGGPIIMGGDGALSCDCGDSCGLCDCGICCAPCDDCGGRCRGCCYPRGCCWVSAEYLLWGFQRPSIPPLVTVSPIGTPDATAGVLGLPTTTTLFDGNTLTNSSRSGMRINAGFWCPWCPDLGLEAGYFFIGRQSENFIFSAGDKLARPMINVGVPPGPNRQPVNFAGLLPGSSVNVNYTDYLWGLEGNLRHKCWCCPWGHVDFLCGYRHVEFEDGLTITENLLYATGGSQTIVDQFTSKNRFDGFQLGLDGECRLWWRFWLGCKLRVGLGNMHQIVNANGFTTPVFPGTGDTSVGAGGLLALPSNMGQVTRDRFAVVPEVNLKLGLTLTRNWRFWVGYDFLYLSEVVRSGEQIDLTVNTNQMPPAIPGGPARPMVLFRTTDFFAQGVNFGLECRY